MYTLCLQHTFIARHFLFGGDWGDENRPHSHPYRVEVRMSAENLDAHGYLADLAQLDPLLTDCASYYRDRLLNELPEFDQINPSLEHLAKRFCDRFLSRLGPHRFSTVEVRIWENEVAWASWRERFPCA